MAEPKPAPTESATGRLRSVDALRGFDMFWIIGGDALAGALARWAGFPEDHWTRTQLARLREPAKRLPLVAPSLDVQATSDPWEAAIVAARAEIRALIESGDLEHDEVTEAWVEQWAADLYRDRRLAA